MHLKMLRGNLEDSHDISTLETFAESVIGELYPPLLKGALKFQASSLGIGSEELQGATGQQQYGRPPRYGEVFPTPHGVVAIEVNNPEPRYRAGPSGTPELAPSQSNLTVYGIGSQDIGNPVAEIGQLLAEEFDVELLDFRYTSEKFRSLKADGRISPSMPTDEEQRSAQLLSDDALRHAAIRIASSGGLLRQELPKHLGDAADRADEIEEMLRQSPLVDVDLVVTCKSRSTQVARAPSRKVLDEMGRQGLKCACGRSVLDERVDEALTLTEHGRQMLNGSYWMSILMVIELLDLGVLLENMLIEQVAGGDEMDFFADVSGELVLMELKDKEFNLGNAYSFGSKTGIFQPSKPIIVTSAYVGNDAKEHFKQAALARRSASTFGDPAGGQEIEYVEGLSNLRSRLEQVVGEIYAQDAKQVLNRVLPYAAASGESLIEGIKGANFALVAESRLPGTSMESSEEASLS